MITFQNIGRMGRFANALFSIAGTIGIARRSGQPFCFPQYVNYDAVDRFGSGEDPNIYQQFVNPLPEYKKLPYTDIPYFWGYRDMVLPTGNWNLNSHFQSEKYFKHCIDEIRYYFTFKDEPALRDHVAIHYRAGDYTADQNGYHPRCTFDYYKRAVQQFPSDSKFIIFSDNWEEAYELLKPLELAVDVADGGTLEDFKLMKSCRHFITANSSYSMLAAILSNQEGKKVVAPARWFGPQAQGLNAGDIYPENCIIL
jgi:hypothetical protein